MIVFAPWGCALCASLTLAPSLLPLLQDTERRFSELLIQTLQFAAKLRANRQKLLRMNCIELLMSKAISALKQATTFGMFGFAILAFPLRLPAFVFSHPQ